MHGTPVAAYPRAGGVVVPAIARRAGCAVRAASTDERDRARAAAETVEWLQGSLRRLPPELLDARLPDPGAILRSWSLGARTRGALARLGDRSDAWRVRDLLGAPRVGPAMLVDLLAAREENDPSLDTAAPRLDELAATIRSRLPMLPEELAALGTSAGVPTRGSTVDGMAALFSEWQMPVPFRQLRRCGANVLVAPTAVAIAEAVLMEASHLVSQSGICSVDGVIDRVRSLGRGDLDVRAATRLLAALPRFRWLDEASGWFSLVGSEGHVGATLRKIFTITDRVRVDELGLALAKRASILAAAPAAVFEAYLLLIADCDVHDGWVEPRTGLPPATLARGELAIVDILCRNGGSLTRASLRRSALASGVRPTTLRDFVRTSSLVVSSARSVRLVGVGTRIASIAVAA
jgi:hypothetical protein